MKHSTYIHLYEITSLRMKLFTVIMNVILLDKAPQMFYH